jgi:FixJ family two-component response regulator
MIVTAQQPIVFIIDDDASVRDGVEDFLRSVGFRGAVIALDGGIP